MLIDGKMAYNEIEQLVHLLKDKIVGSYLKNIYHYDGVWLFKFNHFSFVFVPGLAIWAGDFTGRETKLHSISIKIRKEIRDHKIVSVDLVENDRTVVIQFYNHKVVLE
jgi:predicted ribosome quality control (RQC) complex YloA/Tae2 family protein